MSITFHPNPGTVLICDFSTGFQPPEIVKVRPVIVISPRSRTHDLATVIAVSTTAPRPPQPYHHRLQPESLPAPFRANTCWVKADMIYRVALRRLDRVRAGRNPTGQRVYVAHRITDRDLRAVREAVLHSLGLGELTPYL